MELKPGHDKTATPTIPADWQVVKAAQVGRFRGGDGFPVRFQGNRSGAYPFFKVSDMNSLGNEAFMIAASNWITERERKMLQATAFPAESIVFAKIGAAVFLERKRILAQASCIDNNMAGFVLDSDRAYSRFVYFALLNTRLGPLASTTALPSLTGSALAQLDLVLPPVAEQRLIATALSDADALIGALDRLIAKKRDLKQAAMQQLLTGETRLLGFDGQWQVQLLDTAIGELEAGVSVNSDNDGRQTSPHDQRILKTSAVSNGRFFDSESKIIAGRDVQRARLNPRADSIIISRMNTPDLVGESGYVAKDYPNLFLPDRLWMARGRPGTDICIRWLSQLLGSDRFKRLIKNAATGTSGSMKNISKGALLSLPVAFPTVVEQHAIADVLSDMDSELVALERRRDKTRDLKQGMMQELLTGKTRLV